MFPEGEHDASKEEGRKEGCEEDDEEGRQEAEELEEVARLVRAASARGRPRAPASRYAVPRVARIPPTSEIDDERRARLLAEVRALSGATLQKLWLPSPALAVLQLRVPGRTALTVLDARLALAALVGERPTSTDSSPRSQSTLRAVLEGARLADARLERRADADRSSARVSFETDAGPRALIADGGPALLLLGPAPGGGERIVWAATGAGPDRRPGAAYSRVSEVQTSISTSTPTTPSSTPTTSTSTSHDEDTALLQRALAAEEAAGVAARRRELEKRLRARVRRLARTLAAVDEDAARVREAAADRHRAGLVVPHQGRIPRGAREAAVPDWSNLDERGRPGEVTVKLDPALSAAENAARWFRRAQRLEAAAPRIAARRADVATALAQAESLLGRAAAVRDAADLLAVEADAGAPAASEKRSRTATAERLPYRTFRSSSGARILVGRSAADNDALTLRIARGNDLWLHARGWKGSHVVVPDPGEAPDSRTLTDAALLAAHFSDARGEDGAEVAWTRRKHVRKPKRAPPGTVSISQERSLRVRADPARLAALLATQE